MNFYKILLFIFLFNFSLNQGCKYRSDKDGSENITDAQYLSGTNETENKQSCYSLSFSDVEKNKCCYNTKNKECEVGTVSGGDVQCPEETQIYNNCGMAGVFQPEYENICTEISLVTGYCCFVVTKSHGRACVRTNNLEKDVNEPTKQLKDYVKAINSDAEIDHIICSGTYLKNYFILCMFAILFF